MKPALPAPAQAAAGAFCTITWEALVPPGWDRFKDVRGIDMQAMDTVWISGELNNAQTDSYMGASGWRIGATSVAPSVEPRNEPRNEPTTEPQAEQRQ